MATFIAPAANGLTVQLRGAVASWEDDVAGRLAKELMKAVVAVLYD